MKHNVRISRIMLQILLDRITLGCKMLFGALGGGGGGTRGGGGGVGGGGGGGGGGGDSGLTGCD